MSAFTLTDDQSRVAAAVLAWLETSPTPYLVVGGYAGTGKTTLIAHLRTQLASDKKWKAKKVAFASYTGKATSVLKGKLKDAKAVKTGDTCSTIHSLIYKPRLDDAGGISGWDRAEALATDLIVIDEGSMVNKLIWEDLLSYHIPILVFGDHGQLPPVEGSFNLLQTPHLTMEAIVRQAADNPIIRLSKLVREGGSIPFGVWGKVRKYSVSNPDAWDAFESIASRSSERYLCICGTNRTRIGLNKRIRALKEFEDPEPQKGDRLICLRNNHAKKIFNGMLGTLQEIAPVDDKRFEVRIEFDEASTYDGAISRAQFNLPKTLKMGDPEFVPGPQGGDLFDFGYALTAHKAQGSEAEAALVFEERMPMYDNDMWQRWLYTAVTRAREELYVFGNEA